MLRHLKNATELTLYAAISCGVAFIVRLYPVFFYPVLLLRLAILGYCWYVIAKSEGDKVLATVLGAAISIGWIGGYWDLIEIYISYDQQAILFWLMVLVSLPLTVFVLYLQWNNRPIRKLASQYLQGFETNPCRFCFHEEIRV